MRCVFQLDILFKGISVVADNRDQPDCVDKDREQDHAHDHLREHLFIDKRIGKVMDHDDRETAFDPREGEYGPPAVVDIGDAVAGAGDERELQHHQGPYYGSDQKEAYDLVGVVEELLYLDELGQRDKEQGVGKEGKEGDGLFIGIDARFCRDQPLARAEFALRII